MTVLLKLKKNEYQKKTFTRKTKQKLIDDDDDDELLTQSKTNINRTSIMRCTGFVV